MLGPQGLALPANAEIEQALLGALLIDNRVFAVIAETIRSEDFSVAAHSQIYQGIVTLIGLGQPANPLTLRNAVEAEPAIKAAGGFRYLLQLAQAAVTVINAPHYARTIRELSTRRELIASLTATIQDAYRVELDRPVGSVVADLEHTLWDLTQAGTAARGFVPIGEAAQESIAATEAIYKASGNVAGLGTGLIDLDRITGGLCPGDLIVIGARPSQGKTALAQTIADHVADRHQLGVAMFQLEQSVRQIGQRGLAQRSRVSTQRQRRGDLDQVHWANIIQAADELGRVPLYIDDTPALSLVQIRQRARQLGRRIKLGLVVIDHLQLMRGAESTGRSHERVGEISAITAGLKQLAKDLALPVVVLSQLTRGVEMRDDKRPMLADLRESGSIEQDADVVLFIYREEYYHDRQKPQPRTDDDDTKFNNKVEIWENRAAKIRGLAEIIVAKQREGPTGSVSLRWDAEAMKFENLISGF